MSETKNFSGVIAPVVTPYGEDGSPDLDRFIEHCEWLMQDGCTALAPFGTTSEGNSLGLDERMEMLDELAESSIDPKKLMPGTGACSVADAIILTEHAVDLGCGGVLMLPPFYYKNPSEEGLFRFFSEVIEEVGDDNLKVYLYHIPPIAQVGFSLPLIERLRKEFPKTVVGLKDSSGDWANTKAILEAFPGFEVFPGSETFLLDGLRLGGVRLHLGNGQCRRPQNPARLRQLAGPRGGPAAGRRFGAAEVDPILPDDPLHQGPDRPLSGGPGVGGAAASLHRDAGRGCGEGDRGTRRDAWLQVGVCRGRVSGAFRLILPAKKSGPCPGQGEGPFCEAGGE